MSETTASERASEEARDEAPATPKAAASGGTPVWAWVVYTLGALAGVILLASLGFVALASLTAGDGDAGVDVSMPALVLWLALAIAGGGTFVWRRFGRPR